MRAYEGKTPSRLPEQSQGGDRIILIVKPPAFPAIQLSVDKNGSVYDLKQLIEEESVIPTPIQALAWNGKPLADDRDLRDYDLQNLDTIILTLALHGGTQSKEPHKRKNPRALAMTRKRGPRARNR